MKYHFKMHKEKDGFWAECLELSGCHSQAETKDELLVNMKEALNLYLDEPHDSKLILPLPKRMKESHNIVSVEVDPQISFSFLLRRTRLKKKMTQTEMMKILSFKSVFAYQKLEKSKYANPTLKSLIKIKEVLPEFPMYLLIA